MRHGPACLLFLSALGACAPTTGPTALPVEVLVVLDREERSLRLIAVDSTNVVRTIDLSAVLGGAKPTVLAVRGTTAVVGFGSVGSVLVVDLATRKVVRQVPISGEGEVASVGISEAGLGYAVVPAAPNEPNVSAFDPASGLLSTSRVEGGPQALGVVRGTVFLVLGNRQLCYPAVPSCLNTSSWLKPNPPAFNTNDSIPLTGPGNASATAVGTDGLLYVLSSGNGGTTEGRLSGVDPVTRKEVASFAGFGPKPTYMAADGNDRLLIASLTELMVFNTRDRRVEKGVGAGIPFQSAVPRALVTDAFGRAYLSVGGACLLGGATGVVRVFGTDLVERSAIPVGVCPVASAVTEIPADYFHVEP